MAVGISDGWLGHEASSKSKQTTHQNSPYKRMHRPVHCINVLQGSKCNFFSLDYHIMANSPRIRTPINKAEAADHLGPCYCFDGGPSSAANPRIHHPSKLHCSDCGAGQESQAAIDRSDKGKGRNFFLSRPQLLRPSELLSMEDGRLCSADA